jgi:Rrf2 family protein
MRNSLNVPERLSILSQTGEHALRAMLFLARREDQGFTPASEIAEALGAPPNYLSKTLRLLVRRGLLLSVRGAQGGFRLRRPAHLISTAEVVDAVDEGSPVATCLLGDRPCNPEHPCQAHAKWASLRDLVLKPMADTSIADLLSGPPQTPIDSNDFSTP